MTEFPSYRSYYNFRKQVIRNSRFLQTEETLKFLEAVKSTINKRKLNLEAPIRLYRAQIGSDTRSVPVCDDDEILIDEYDVDCPYPKDRMVPDAEHCGDNRANPRGIPILYLSTSSETAIAETRPWLSSILTVARFVLKRDISVVDCTKDNDKIPFFVLKNLVQKRERA